MPTREPPAFDIRGRRIKKCRKCRRYLPLDCFNTNRVSADGRRSYCRSCYSEYNKARYIALREHPSDRERPAKPMRFPKANRKCPVCGHYYASFKELWHGSICAYCASERVAGGVIPYANQLR